MPACRRWTGWSPGWSGCSSASGITPIDPTASCAVRWVAAAPTHRISLPALHMTQPNASSHTPALKRTPLYERHVAAGARMVDFAGWNMPIQYEGILAEARAVRSDAGIFDVSHMGRVEVTGKDAAAFLHRTVTGDVAGMPLRRARYTFVCNEAGGIIDDTIVYRLGDERFLLVPNAANADEVLAWLARWREAWGHDVEMNVVTEETALIALQWAERAGDASTRMRGRPVGRAPVQVRGDAGVRRAGSGGPNGLHGRGRLRDGAARRAGRGRVESAGGCRRGALRAGRGATC